MHEEIETMGQKVGYVIDIIGSRLMYIRKYPSGLIGTFQAYNRMPIYLNDHLTTDRKTQAVLEFDIGGQAGISFDTEVVVLGQRNIEVVGNQLPGKAAKMWARIDKRRSQVQIQTSGGVIGIEG